MATRTTLPAAWTTGEVLTATAINDLRGAFRVLQVVTANYSTGATNNSSTYADTGLSASITPSASTSKVLIIVSQTFGKTAGNSLNAVKAQLVRGSTVISVFQEAALYTGTALDLVGPSTSCVYLDSPATTSATTYKTQFANYTNAAGVNAQTNGANATMILCEISA